MDKFQNKYRIQSTRLQNWNYGWNGAYFITICTQNREHFFGEIADEKMELSGIGKWAEKCLLEIPERYEYTKLDEFIVMPNHVHVIVIIDKMDGGRGGLGGKNAIDRVSTEKPQPGGITGNKNPMLHDNISRVFNWYKGRVTFESRKINKNYGWKPGKIIKCLIINTGHRAGRFPAHRKMPCTVPEGFRCTGKHPAPFPMISGVPEIALRGARRFPVY